jgi:14-3-3 protein epsilon
LLVLFLFLFFNTNTQHTTMMAEREAWVYKAKLAENAERYDDMVATVKEVAASGEGLSVEERVMFSVAYANLIGSARASWRVVSSILKREERLEEKVERKVRLARALVRKLEGEMDSICQECVDLIDDHFLPSASDLDSQTFFLKQYALRLHLLQLSVCTSRTF